MAKQLPLWVLSFLTLGSAAAALSMAIMAWLWPEFVTLGKRSAVGLLIGATLAWLLSIPLQDVSVVDIWWPLGFLTQSIVTACFSTSSLCARQWLTFALITVWSLRLAGYLVWRKIQEGGKEDSRYNDYVLIFKRGTHSDWLVVLGSLANPFVFQACWLLIIGAPVVFIIGWPSGPDLKLLDLCALLTWCIGFSFEAGSDWQLAKFKADASNHGRVLQSGFFKYTRHPNYFGDSAVWFSFWFFSVSHDKMALVLIGAPVLMYILLRYVSGAELLDTEIKSRKPKYQEYIVQVSPFFPCPRRKNQE